MNHKEVQKKLIFYLEESLPDEEQIAIRLHLKACETCRFYFEELQTDFKLLEEEKRRESSPYFYTRLKSRMEQPKQPVFLGKRLLQPALFVLLLLVSIGFGAEIGAELTNSTQKTPQEKIVLLPFDGVKEEPIEQFLLTME